MKKNLIMLVAVLGFSLTLTGCFKSPSQKLGEKMVEKAIESQSGGNVDVDTNSGTMNFKSDDGNTQVSTGGEVDLPDGFPEELIIAGDAKVIIASSADKTMSVAYQTDGDQSELFADYKTKLIDQGWAKEFEMDAGTGKVVNFKKGTQRASITISENSNKDEKQTMVNVILSEE
jgi:hypothetical protein